MRSAARGRRGQVVVEYMFLLCATLTVTVMTGSFLQKYGPQLTERLLDRIQSAAIALASP